MFFCIFPYASWRNMDQNTFYKTCPRTNRKHIIWTNNKDFKKNPKTNLCPKHICICTYIYIYTYYIYIYILYIYIHIIYIYIGSYQDTESTANNDVNWSSCYWDILCWQFRTLNDLEDFWAKNLEPDISRTGVLTKNKETIIIFIITRANCKIMV